jgi:hypothetical protein
MHALHLPPRHIWRVTLLAALLALLFTALLAVPIGDLRSGRGSDVSSTTPQAVATAPSTGHRTDKPAWIANPVAPPTLALRAGS